MDIIEQQKKQEEREVAVAAWIGLALIVLPTLINAFWGSKDAHTLIASMIAALGGTLLGPFAFCKISSRMEK